MGISTVDVDEESSDKQETSLAKQHKNKFDLTTMETFQLNIASQQFTKVSKKTLFTKIDSYLPSSPDPMLPKQSKAQSQKQEWLKEVECVTFYPSMMIQQSLNPFVTIAEPTKEFLQLNKSDNILFDFDLSKHLSLIRKPPPAIHEPKFVFNYSYNSQLPTASSLV